MGTAHARPLSAPSFCSLPPSAGVGDYAQRPRPTWTSAVAQVVAHEFTVRGGRREAVFAGSEAAKVEQVLRDTLEKGFMDKHKVIHDIVDDAALGLGVAGLTLATGGLGDAAVLGAEGTGATVEAEATETAADEGASKAAIRSINTIYLGLVLMALDGGYYGETNLGPFHKKHV